MIRKLPSGKYRLYSRKTNPKTGKHKNLGTFDSREAAEKRAAEEARFKSLFTGQPDKRNAAMDAWDKANPPPKAEIGIIADHIEHIVKVAGHDHVGLGGDLDGIPYDQSPPGMNSVAGYPLIFAELIRRGWNDKDLAKLAGGNILRVLRQAEAVSASMKDVPPSLATPSPPGRWPGPARRPIPHTIGAGRRGGNEGAVGGEVPVFTIPSFPRSAWECPLGRSAARGAQREALPAASPRRLRERGTYD